MKFYFSGVAGKTEFRWLMAAGVERILCDPNDLKFIGPEYQGALALDSGAYLVWKKGTPLLPVEDYYRLARSRPLDFAVAQDVVDDPEATLESWRRFFAPAATCSSEVPFVPVWTTGAPGDHLKRYLDEARLVAIGGLVLLMREKDGPMLDRLTRLCADHPGRFHVLGMNWLKALEVLRQTVHSCDSSKAWDGGRYRMHIFRHTLNGHLTQAPARVLGMGEWTREALCVENTRDLRDFMEEDRSSDRCDEHENREPILRDALHP